MRLLPIPDASGKPTMWINADHLVSVVPVFRPAPAGVALEVELKVDGLPLQRIRLGDHGDRAAAEAAFLHFVARIEGRDASVD